jgi:hypothetical protein
LFYTLLFLSPTPTGEETVISDGSTLAVSDGEKLQALSQLRPAGAVAQLAGKPVHGALKQLVAD